MHRRTPDQRTTQWARIAVCADQAARLLLPVTCLGCSRVGERLCSDCSAWLATTAPVRGSFAGDIPAIARWTYSGPGREIILSTKQRGRRDGIALLGNALSEAITLLPDVRHGARIVVPAPSRWWATRKRGVHVVEQVALQAARIAPDAIGGVHQPLGTRRLRGDQKHRDAAARAGRSAELYEVPDAHALRGKHVVVVDDVVTTGATARAALAAVTRARPASVTFAAVAHVPRRS